MGPPLYMRSIIDWNIVVHDCNENYHHKDTYGNYEILLYTLQYSLQLPQPSKQCPLA